MKQVRCINGKNYRLTVGNEYSVESIPTREGYYSVINDTGRQSVYSQSLFEDISVESTVEEIMESLTINVTDQNVVLNFVIDGNSRRILAGKLIESESTISCGIRQMHGLNSFTANLLNSLSEFNRDDLVQRLITRAYSAMINESSSCGMILLSTNTNASSFSQTDQALSSLSQVTYSTINPNGGNTIKLWVINVTENFLEPDDEDTE